LKDFLLKGDISDPADNAAREETSDLAEDFKHRGFGGWARGPRPYEYFGRSVGRLNKNAAMFDVKFPHFDFYAPMRYNSKRHDPP